MSTYLYQGFWAIDESTDECREGEFNWFAETGSEMPTWQGFAKMAVAPGLKTGRGLERSLDPRYGDPIPVAPGLKTGRGLELAPHLLLVGKLL